MNTNKLNCCCGDDRICPAQLSDHPIQGISLDCMAGKLTSFDAVCGYVSQLEIKLSEALKTIGILNRRAAKYQPFADTAIIDQNLFDWYDKNKYKVDLSQVGNDSGWTLKHAILYAMKEEKSTVE